MSSPSTTIPLTSQVGGHAGSVLTSEDGSLLIKPALPLELQFYQTLLSSDDNFEPLRPFVARFYGTLKLEGKVAEGKAVSESMSGMQIVAIDESLEVEEKDELFFFNPISTLFLFFVSKNICFCCWVRGLKFPLRYNPSFSRTSRIRS